MDLTLLESAVIYSALEQYIPYCEDCLNDQENEKQITFIQVDIDIAKALMAKIKDHYVSIGGTKALA